VSLAGGRPNQIPTPLSGPAPGSLSWQPDRVVELGGPLADPFELLLEAGLVGIHRPLEQAPAHQEPDRPERGRREPQRSALEGLVAALGGALVEVVEKSRSRVPRTLSPSVPSFFSAFSMSFGRSAFGSGASS
jgi:hypothetical protein